LRESIYIFELETRTILRLPCWNKGCFTTIPLKFWW